MADPSDKLPERVVIVGAGHGGGTAATLLRQEGFEGEVLLIGEEPFSPYHRPPLSKSLFESELEQPLKPEQFYSDQGIELRTACCVTEIDADGGTLRHGGETIPFDVLILAPGAVARQLPIPGIELGGVHELRTLSDAETLRDALSADRRLAIVGGGFIGLEVAASARSAGVDVTVIEREERLLARVASEGLSAHLTEHHVNHGTELLTSAQVSGLAAGDNGSVGAVELADGRTVTCDRVLLGVGAVANDALARAAGLPCEDGIVVDLCARTANPNIYAVGDVTRRPLTFHEGLFRLESIPSAVEQARQAVASILGKPPPMAEVPWFWSDQFDLKLKIAGLILDADTVTARRPGGNGALALFHTRGGRLLAVETVNAPAEFMAAKHMLRDGLEPDLELLAKAEIPLEEIVPELRQQAESPADDPAAELIGSAAEIAPPAERRPGFVQVTYVQSDGEAAAVEVAEGLSLMEGAVRNNLPGIIAECGGMCSCGTCHVHVEEQWRDELAEPEYEETEMLEFLEGASESSRLSCQIPLGEELHGLVVHVPEFEG